jgi:hypothetical protein
VQSLGAGDNQLDQGDATMKNRSMRRWLGLPLLLLFTVVGYGCDNPVGTGGGHPEGLVITNTQGVEVASYLHPTTTSTGRLTVQAGSTADFRVQLLRRDGSRIDLDGIEYRIEQVAVVTGLMASASFSGADQLRVTGNSAGSTSLVLQVWHGNHPEFTATVSLLVE